MSYITESQLSNYNYRSKRTFSKDNIVNLSKNSFRDKTRPMIFLSHKHEEGIILQSSIAFLKEEGVDIYVDWMDEDMPAYTSAETALRLKEKIKAADKFILLATPDAINSKWCNWELGLGDAAKYKDHIALLPINKNSQSFRGAEYLRIYPYIEYEDGTNTYTSGLYIPKGYYVKVPLNPNLENVVPLKVWLRR